MTRAWLLLSVYENSLDLTWGLLVSLQFSMLSAISRLIDSSESAASGKFSIRAFVLCRTGQIIEQLIDTSSGLFRIYKVLLLTQIREEPRTDRVQAMKVGRARPRSNQNASSITALVLVKVLVDPNHPSVTS
ncbi:hypothetical protein BJV77DRAFT_1026599 [Russula vinacea]|nr:hypothetical protein BJV77DRAFT_1026599 [Russula vinacea]